ncbi:MAG: hypothetical protein C5B48_10145 [Candidatus Rokuibacteriota bacterium]|nr:MAG: hypothetical protein C5B48_10145 [Candidatus Rokubacteria bacterium]
MFSVVVMIIDREPLASPPARSLTELGTPVSGCMLPPLAAYEQNREVSAVLSRDAPYAGGMWDVLTWHDGTLAIAWWAVIVLIVALLSIGGSAAARRK